MKKFIAILLAALVVIPAIFVFSASAEEPENVALNKSYVISGTGAGYVNLNGQWPSRYQAELTDGVNYEELSYGETNNWFGFYYKSDASEDLINAPDGVGTCTVDLEAVYDVTDACAFVATPCINGIGIPASTSVAVSVDGETFTEIGSFELSKKDDPYWASVTVETPVKARYVRFTFVNDPAQGVFNFLNEVQVYGTPATEEPAGVKLWNETESVNEEGDYHYDTAYGFDFDIDYVNGKIVGEDGTIVTNAEAYAVCNPNWAISIVLKNLGDGKFEVVREPIVTPGSAEKANVTWDDDTVVMVIHSSTSSKDKAEAQGFDNWQQKVVAMALKVGDTLTASGIDLEAGTVDGGKMHVDVPGGSGEPTTIQETIAIDGVLDDTGWSEEGWIEASLENGNASVQGEQGEKPDFTFKTQLRTDKEYLYVAVVIDKPLVKGNASGRSGSNVRIWFHVDDEYDRYTHFYDNWSDEEGNPCNAAKYNTAKDSNSGAAIENSSIETAVSEIDGKAVFEFRVKYGEFLPEGAEVIRFFVNPTDIYDAENNKSISMYYPAIPFETGDPNMPWTYWNSELEGRLNIADAALGEITVEPEPIPEDPVEPEDTYEEEIIRAMGEAVDNPEFKVKVAADKTEYKAGDTVKVTFTLDEIAAPDGVTLFEFDACFDGSKLELVYDDTDFDSDSAFHPALNVETKSINDKGKPKFESAWESLCSIDAENNTVKIKYMTTDADEAAKSGDIVITLTFNVKADAEGKVGVWVPNGTANDRLVTASDFDFNEYVGSGEYVIVNPAADDTSDDNSDTSDTSDTSGHNQTSDYTTNLIVLAIVALVAVAGSAIVIKTRR